MRSAGTESPPTGPSSVGLTPRQAGCACPLCRVPMRRLALPGPHGSPVEVDHCRDCRLVWFEMLELHTLARPGWVALLTELARAAPDAVAAPPSTPSCPRCNARLRATPQVGDFGRSVRLACPQGHGEAVHDGALLASRGLFRPLLLDERVALAREHRRLHCLPCGAALQGGSETCAFCASPATVVDLQRLRQALGLGHLNHGDAPLMPWACHGCGFALDASVHARCPQCAHPVLAPRLDDLLPLLDAARTRAEQREHEAADATLRVVQPGLRQRVATLTGRTEHQLAVQQLEGRFWRRWGWLVLATAVFALLAKCGSSR